MKIELMGLLLRGTTYVLLKLKV